MTFDPGQGIGFRHLFGAPFPSGSRQIGDSLARSSGTALTFVRGIFCLRRGFEAAFAAAGLVLFVPAAVAQALIPTVNQRLLNDYLNNGEPGLASEPGAEARAQNRPNYDYGGVQFPGYTVRTGLSGTAGYDDNVNGAGHGRSSPLLIAGVNLGWYSNWSRNSAYASIDASRLSYLDLPQYSTTPWSAIAGGSYDVGRHKILVTYSHQVLYQSPRDLAVPQLDQALQYRVDDAQIAFAADLGRIKLTPAVDVSYISYDNGSVGGQPYRDSFLDNITVTPSLTGRYEFSPRRSLVAVVQNSHASFFHRQGDQPLQDYDDLTGLVGFDYDTGAAVELRLLAGYEYRVYKSSLYRPISSPSFQGNIIWTPTGLTTVTGIVSRELSNSNDTSGSSLAATNISLHVRHELLRNVILDGGAGFSLSEGESQSGDQQLYSANAAATWLLSRTVRASVSYDFSQRQSSNIGSSPLASGAVVNSIAQNYRDNRILLTVRFGL